ncbi:MAG: quinolinate synthase [Firmicutes bacterium HGW-Firmicutes-21]|nr:MAG: quinolinate synthase [Firmicutes bacterium HGW-Firmicutes-21]
MIRNIQDDIIRIKKEKDICIIAHSYQSREICEVADYVGDSFQLSVSAMNAPQRNILMCGVRFMAETAKILAPEKTVYIAHSEAGCPMAEQMNKEYILKMKEFYKGYTVVAYINTTAELKTVADVCVTSSSAVKIVNAIDNKNILFVPDSNLGDYVARQCPDKNIQLLQGGCPVHAAITRKDAENAKKAHPNALLLVHPECRREVLELADFVGSTSGIMDFARKSDHGEFIIGTENSIAEHLQYDEPHKMFYTLSMKFICPNMKITTLVDVYNAVMYDKGFLIDMDKETLTKARKCIDEMIRLGK